MTRLYMLDTNTVSYILKGVSRPLASVLPNSVEMK